MNKVILLKVSTGFCGCDHEEEVEYTGQTEEEIQELLNDFREDIATNTLEATYEIEEDGDDDE